MFGYLFGTTNPVLIVSAIAPAIFLLYKVYKLDRLEAEPISLLVKLVFASMLSAFLAVVLETIGELVLDVISEEGTFFYNLLLYMGVVAFGEEWAKYLILKKNTWKHPAFNCQFDGVVYCVFVSLGFALWENIGYVASYGLSVAAVRALTAIPGHACFGVFMGVYYGLAKRCELAGEVSRSKKYRKRAVYLAALLHGIYDFIASMETEYSGLVFLIFIILMFINALKLIKQLAKEDIYMVQPEDRLYP